MAWPKALTLLEAGAAKVLAQSLAVNNSYFLMRHGESEANRAGLIISDPATGCRRYGLTELGREQAAASSRQSELGPHTLVICSDFLRAKETAEVAAQTLGASVLRTEVGLRERFFGELEGQSGERYKEVWRQDSLNPDNTIYNCEAPAHLAGRLGATMARLEEEFSARTILLVSHGDTLRFLQLAMARRPLTEHMEVALFKPAEIRALESLSPARD